MPQTKKQGLHKDRQSEPKLRIQGIQQNALVTFPTSFTAPTPNVGVFDPRTMKDPFLNRMQFDVVYKF